MWLPNHPNQRLVYKMLYTVHDCMSYMSSGCWKTGAEPERQVRSKLLLKSNAAHLIWSSFSVVRGRGHNMRGVNIYRDVSDPTHSTGENYVTPSERKMMFADETPPRTCLIRYRSPMQDDSKRNY